MDDAEKGFSILGILSLLASSGLFFAAGLLTGPLAVACGVLGGMALTAGLAASVFAPRLGDPDEWPDPRPQEPAIEPSAAPQPAIHLHVDAPPSVRRWRERVEADAQAAERSR